MEAPIALRSDQRRAFLKPAQRRAQDAVYTLAPVDHFGKRFVRRPVHLHPRKCSLDVGNDRKSLCNIAQGSHLDDKNSLH